MPKNSSKSKQDWVSAADTINQGLPKRVWVIAGIVLLIAVAAFVFFKPKPQAIENVVPSAAIAFVRLHDVHDHLSALRSSGFWQGFSNVDVPKLLAHSKFDPITVKNYNSWRSRMDGVIDHPLFKQFLGHEVAFAYYPVGDVANPLDWTNYASGILAVARTDVDAQVTELLANIWSQGNKGWIIEQTRYKNSTITVLHIKDPKVTLYYTRIRDLLIFSMNENLVASSIDTSKHKSLSLSQDGNFVTVAKRFYDAPDGVLFIDMPRVRDFLSKKLERMANVVRDDVADNEPEDRPTVEDELEGFLGRLDGIKANGASFVAGRPLKAKLDVLFDPSGLDPETAAALNCAPTDHATINFVPKDAVMYQWINCFDFRKYYQGLAPELAGEGEEVPASAAPFAALEKTWGFSIEKDLLPILGRELGWFVEGVEVGGLFPVPKLVLFTNVNDEKKADEILKKIVTTPVTLVQQEEYEGYRIQFVSIPLFASFKPSYAFINGYVLIATSDDLIKEAINALKDPEQSLRDQAIYKNLQNKAPETGNAVSFMDVGKVAGQARSLIDWTNQWFLQKIKHADAEAQAARQKLQAVTETIAVKEQALKTAREKLITLEIESKKLEAALGGQAVAAESKDTLSQPGQVSDEQVKPESTTADEVKLKKSQVAGLTVEIDGIGLEIDDLNSQQLDLSDDVDDYNQQRTEAEEFQYYVEEVLVPLLKGLESLSGQLIFTRFRDNAVESEMLLESK